MSSFVALFQQELLQEQLICNNLSTVLTVSGEQASAVKWQQSTDNFSSDVSDVNTGTGYNTTNFTTANLTTTTYYRMAATCTGDYSDQVNLTSLRLLSILL